MVVLGVPIESESRVSGNLDLYDFPPLSGVNAGAAAVNIDDGVADVNTDAGHVVSGEASGQKLDWKSLFQNQSLSFFPPVERDGKIVVKPPLQVLADGAKQWTNALLGVRDWVLESGPWHIQQRAIILRKWTPGMLPEVVSLETSPVWIKLWHVPLELYSQQGLGYVASALVELSESNRVEVTVELVWTPPKYDHCSIFGHSFDKCVKRDVLVVNVNIEVVNTVDKVAGSVQSFVEIGEQGESTVVGDKNGKSSNSLNVSTEHNASPISEVWDVSADVACADVSLCVGNIVVDRV
ncbi:hypothetical protein V6N13_044587 [Hibiscus sabdariffa]